MIIPDGEILYRYAKPKAFPEGQTEIPVSIFNDPNLSCDWARYRPDPSSSFHTQIGNTVIVEITVCEEIKNPENPQRSGQIVPDWKQEVIHDPLTKEHDPHGANEAHSLIKGKKKSAVVDAIKKYAKIHPASTF